MITRFKWLKTAYITIFLIILGIFIGLFLIRLVSEVQVDDVSPQISCSQDILSKADNLFVIPKFENISISDNKSWCGQILSLNKTISLHGVYHTYNEFLINRDEKYLEEGISIFKDCFGFYPKEFKPPQLAISNENRKLIKIKMKLLNYLNQITHKVYHCNDSTKQNWISNLF